MKKPHQDLKNKTTFELENLELVFIEVIGKLQGSNPVPVGCYVKNKHGKFLHVCSKKTQKIVPSALIGYALNGATIAALCEPMKIGSDISQISVFAQPDGKFILHEGKSQHNIYVDLKKREVDINFLSSASRIY